MYDIITSQPEDTAVQAAINAYLDDSKDSDSEIQSLLPVTEYRLITPNEMTPQGNGGAGKNVLVVVDHGSAGTLHGRSWKDYKKLFETIDKTGTIWANKKKVYLVACSTAEQLSGWFKTFFSNIATQVKKDYPNATVYASEAPVNAKTLKGTWTLVG